MNRHPSLAICGETHFYHYVYVRRQAFGDLASLENRRRVVEEYVSTERLRMLGMDRSALGARLMREATGYRQMFTSLLEFYADSQGKPRYGEKTPHHALFTETLCEWFPGAFILHLVRDPRDVVASLQRMPWAPKNVVTNARMWLECNLGAHRSSHRPGYLRIAYEQLAAQPEQELSRICAFIGCEFVPEMLQPGQSPEFRPGPHPYLERVNPEMLGKWQHELTPGDVALIEWIAGPSLEAFGYQAAGRAPSRWEIARGLSLSAIDTFRKWVVEFPGAWYYLMQPTRIASEEYWKNRRNWRRAGVPFCIPWRYTEDGNPK